MDPKVGSNSDRPPRRTALVAAELRRYNIDIAAISETRLPGEDSLTEMGEGYTFFWKGLSPDAPRLHGVGFAIKSDLLRRLPETPVRPKKTKTFANALFADLNKEWKGGEGLLHWLRGMDATNQSHCTCETESEVKPAAGASAVSTRLCRTSAILV